MENLPQEKENVFAKQTFNPDLKPLYVLTEPQYQTIINQLSNLVVAVIEQYKSSTQRELAQQVATQAHAVLQDYDEDVADKIEQMMQPQTERVPSGAYTQSDAVGDNL
jgi:flagellar biosynthesis/type III secretory pathway protein FliH